MTNRTCKVCTELFTPRDSRNIYCSRQCKDKGKPCKNTGTCTICGKPMEKGPSSTSDDSMAHHACRADMLAAGAYCGTRTGYCNGCRCDECKQFMSRYMRDYADRVRAEHGVGPSTLFMRRFKEEAGYRYRKASGEWIAPVDRIALYERDNWTCHLCGLPVEPDAQWNSDMFPSLDHLIPRSQGGGHDHSNLATAHRICNSTRRDTPLEDYLGIVTHRDNPMEEDQSSTQRTLH